MPNQRAEDKVIVAAFVPGELRADFRESCAAGGSDMSKVLTEFMEEFVMAHKRVVGEFRARKKQSALAKGNVRRRLGLPNGKPARR